MQTIYLDISNKGAIPTIHAKQGDVGRKFLAVITDSGVPHHLDSDDLFSVWYEGDSGEGNYSEIDGRSAFSVNGNKIAVEMVTQMLTNPGNGVLSLVINDPTGQQIGLWNIEYVVEAVPGMDSPEADQYYTAFLNAIKEMALVGVESSSFPGCYYRVVNGETEWLNPPMEIGVEYRTTERYMGKAVYTKLIDLGTLPNATAKYVSHNISLTQGLRCCAHIVGGDTIPAIVNASSYMVTAYLSSLFVIVETKSDISKDTARAQLWYTKD